MANQKPIIIGGFKTTSRSTKGYSSLMSIIVPDVENTRILMGVPADTANDRETEDEEKSDINNAYLLSIHEHGSIDGRIPARPLLEPVIKQEEQFIKRGWAKYIKLMGEGSMEAAQTHIQKMALYMEGKLVEYFDNNNWTPNAPSTIARKGSAKPLIDTGDLRRSIRAFVDEGGS